MVRLSWFQRRNGRHRKLRLAQIAEGQAELSLQVDDLRDAITALQPARTSHAEDIPPELAAAMAGARQDGEGLILDVDGEEVIVVVGPEGRDPRAVWGFLRQAAS